MSYYDADETIEIQIYDGGWVVMYEKWVSGPDRGKLVKKARRMYTKKEDVLNFVKERLG